MDLSTRLVNTGKSGGAGLADVALCSKVMAREAGGWLLAVKGCTT